MASPLQKAPLGLLQALNLQTLGEAPRFFSDTVVPVFRAEPYYLRDLTQARAEVFVGAIGGGAAAVGHVIPPNENWLLYGAAANLVLDPADAASASQLTIRVQLNAGIETQVAESIDDGVLQLPSRFARFWWPEPFMLRPGDTLESGVGNIGGTWSANITLRLHVIAAVIPL